MSTMQIELTDETLARVLAQARGCRVTPEEMVPDAVTRLAGDVEANERQKFLAWREALLELEGMWKDRTDLPDFTEIRMTWDRDHCNR